MMVPRLATAAIMLSLAFLATVPAAAEPQQGALVGAAAAHVVAEGETMPELARRFDVGFIEMMAANPRTSVWTPTVGAIITVPTRHLLPAAERRGIVINLAELRLYLFGRDGALAATYPVGIGVDGAETPTVTTSVMAKRRDPTWTPPASIRAENPDLPKVVPAGPDNPMGAFALDLALRSYAIHGTNRPLGIGRRVSHGCIRLYPEDIARLFEQVAVGTQVRIVDQPVKLAWAEDRLWLEIHPSRRQQAAIDAGAPVVPETDRALASLVRAAAGDAADRIDWLAVRLADLHRTGLPVAIATAAPGL